MDKYIRRRFNVKCSPVIVVLQSGSEGYVGSVKCNEEMTMVKFECNSS
jgi:hypothetical protein